MAWLRSQRASGGGHGPPLSRRLHAGTAQRDHVPPASIASSPARTGGGDASFDFQRFDVYRVALEFQGLVPSLLPRRGLAALRDQLDRASASVLLNIAEGAGRSSRGDKAQFYAIARGSAMESAAVVDLLLARALITPAAHRHAHGLLIRVTQMLTKLVRRMQA